MDFYDFYDFEDESCYKRKFNIYNATTGTEVVEHLQIPPESEVALDCYLNAMGEESYDFEVEVQVTHGEKTKIKILAEVQDVHMSMNRNSINMR